MLRYEIEENGKLVQFIFNDDEVVCEKNTDDVIRLIRGYELIASDCESAKTYYHYLSDEQLSITHICDDENVLNRYEYDAFGKAVLCEEIVSNRFRYTGQQFDSVTQQYYLRARFYNPVIARFTQEDIYHGDGLNLYAYCGNNPVTYFDPSGYKKKGLTPEQKLQRDEYIKSILGYSKIPTFNQDKNWFDKITVEQLNDLYKNQHAKEVVKKHLRAGGSKHEWFLVAFANKFKRWGLTADDITKQITLTADVSFIKLSVGSLEISGGHGGQSGYHAHNKIIDLIEKSNNPTEYVNKLREWADKHFVGGSKSLPGFLKAGEELPDHLKSCKGDCYDKC